MKQNNYLFYDEKTRKLLRTEVLMGNRTKLPKPGETIDSFCDATSNITRYAVKKAVRSDEMDDTSNTTTTIIDVEIPDKILISFGCGHQLFMLNLTENILDDNLPTTTCQICRRR